MRPIKFDDCNVTMGENQDEYFNLPALKMRSGIVVSCWKLSFIERIKVLFGNPIWLSLWTFNDPMQPVNLLLEKPYEMEGEDGATI